MSGFEVMLRFVQRASGAPVYVPNDLERLNQRYSLDLSPSDHQRLIGHVDCRGAVSTPSAYGVFLAIRRAALQIAITSGEPDREIARRFGASIRYVKQEKSKQRGARETA